MHRGLLELAMLLGLLGLAGLLGLLGLAGLLGLVWARELVRMMSSSLLVCHTIHEQTKNTNAAIIVVCHRGAHGREFEPHSRQSFSPFALNSSCNFAYSLTGGDHRESVICLEF